MNESGKKIIIKTLQERFEKHMYRHKHVLWRNIEDKLVGDSRTLVSLYKMEETGGEPDIVSIGKSEIGFIDCSKESPIGRRSLCYDKKAFDMRKKK